VLAASASAASTCLSACPAPCAALLLLLLLLLRPRLPLPALPSSCCRSSAGVQPGLSCRPSVQPCSLPTAQSSDTQLLRGCMMAPAVKVGEL
jgi:hypothetical protein